MSWLISLSHVGRNGQDSLVCWIMPNGDRGSGEQERMVRHAGLASARLIPLLCEIELI
jgi:hypothetical protein